jgi:hypothetical protein
MKLKYYKDKFWEPFETPMFVGDVPSVSAVEVVKGDPTMAYRGGKIPVPLLRQVLAFMKWSYDLSKGEAQARLFYNEDTQEWGAWVFPQEKSYSLHTKEIADHPKRAEGMERFPSPWEPFGTIHHHCGASAFQSGTDFNDEQKQPGLHITYGHMDKPSYDWHARLNLRGEFYNIIKESWFTLSDSYNGFPSKVRDFALTCLLTDEVTKEELDSIPQEWKDNIIVTPPASLSKALSVVPDGRGGAILHTRRGERTRYSGYEGAANGRKHDTYQHGKTWDPESKQYYWPHELKAMGKMDDYINTRTDGYSSNQDVLSAIDKDADAQYEDWLRRRGIDMTDPEFSEECVEYMQGTILPACDRAFLTCPRLSLDYTMDDLFGALNKVGLTNKNRLTGENQVAVEVCNGIAMRHGMPWYWFVKVIEYIWEQESREEVAAGTESATEVKLMSTVEEASDATRGALTEEEKVIIRAKVKEARRTNMNPQDLHTALTGLDVDEAVEIVQDADGELQMEEETAMHGIGG